MTHLWEMSTLWFDKPPNEVVNATFPYRSWKEFTECKPHKLWKPYILSSWSWKKCLLDEIDPNKAKKQRDKQTHVLDSTDILRLYPSQYDKEKPFPRANEKEVEVLQIVFLSPDRFTGIHRVEVRVKQEDEDEIRDWLTNHMPTIWKL
jgi:hypothetical protein